jgi:hypothetical protein
MIEAHYSAFIVDAMDDLAMKTLLPLFTPREAGKPDRETIGADVGMSQCFKKKAPRSSRMKASAPA